MYKTVQQLSNYLEFRKKLCKVIILSRQLFLRKMAVKDVKKEICKKVRLRRVAVSNPSGAPIVTSPRPRTFPSIRYLPNAPPVSNRLISPLLSPELPRALSRFVVDHWTVRRDDINYEGLSVDRILDSPYVEVARLLRGLDMMRDCDLIVEMMLHFSLVMKGLPDCPEVDLPLAVYIFIEDTFGIQSRMVKCVKICSYEDKMNVGVIFDSIRMKYDVLKKGQLLEGTEVRIINNHTLTWFGLYPDAPT